MRSKKVKPHIVFHIRLDNGFATRIEIAIVVGALAGEETVTCIPELQQLQRETQKLLDKREELKPALSAAKETMASIGRRLAALQNDYNKMRTKYVSIQAQDDGIT